MSACGSPSQAERPPRPSPQKNAPAKNAGPAVAPAIVDVEQALAYDPADPLANLEAADALDALAKGKVSANVKPPARGCAVQDEGRRIWEARGPSAIVTSGSGFVIAGYGVRQGREQLWVVHVASDGRPEPITAFDIVPAHTAARLSPPGLSVRDENDFTVAYTDGQGRLHARRLRLGRAGGGAALEIASGVDTRFAPALAHTQDLTLLAYTSATTPMRTHLAILAEDAVRTRHDLTPISMGAAAPTFVAGTSSPSLLMLDARNGLSPLLRVEFDHDGTPRPAQVVLPLNMVSTPPELAAATSPIGSYVAFAGLGSAATSAIGLLAVAPKLGKPEALIKGVGYGQLHLAATSAPHAVLIAADTPTAPSKDAPRAIHVYVVDEKGPGPVAIVRGAGGATHAAIARDNAGNVGVAFKSPAGVYLARLRCDDGG